MTALIFDCDGVLVDTETMGRKELEWVLSSTVAAAPQAHELWATGEPLGVCLARAAHELPGWPQGLSPREVEQQVRHRMEHNFRLRSWAVAGMPSLVTELNDMLLNLRKRPSIAVCSNGPGSKMRLSLRHEDYGCIDPSLHFSGLDLGLVKPAPDMLLLAAQCMGADPATCIAIDDSEPGLRAAERARMFTCAFGPDSKRLAACGLAQVWAEDATQLRSILVQHIKKATLGTQG